MHNAYLVGEAENIYHQNFGLHHSLEKAIKQRSKLQFEQPKKNIVIEEFLTETKFKGDLCSKRFTW